MTTFKEVHNDYIPLLSGMKTILRIANFDIVDLINKAQFFDQATSSILSRNFLKGMLKTHPDLNDHVRTPDFYRYEDAKELVLNHFNDPQKFQSLKQNKEFINNLTFLYNYLQASEYLGKICSFENFDDCSNYNMKSLMSEYETKKRADQLIQEEKNAERKMIDCAKIKVQRHVDIVCDDLFISGIYDGKTPYEGQAPICCLSELSDYCGDVTPETIISETERNKFIILVCCKKLVHKACYNIHLYNSITKSNSDDVLKDINSLKYELKCPSCHVNEYTPELIDINTFILDKPTTNKRNQNWFNEIFFRSLTAIRNLETKTSHEKYQLKRHNNELQENLDLSEKENKNLKTELISLKLRIDKMSTHKESTLLSSPLNISNVSTTANTTFDSFENSIMDTTSDHCIVDDESYNPNDESYSNNYYSEQQNDEINNDIIDTNESSPVDNNNNNNNNNNSKITTISNICIRCSNEVKEKSYSVGIINSTDLLSSHQEKLQMKKFLKASMLQALIGVREISQHAIVTNEETTILAQCPNKPCQRYIRITKIDGKLKYGGKQFQSFRSHICIGLDNLKSNLKIKTLKSN